jgi:hypothetical protein
MRRLVIAGALGVCVLGAQAQTEKRPVSQAQSLSCLVKPTSAPRFPERGRLDKSYGGMRVLLRFKQADAAPEVEVLLNTATEDMQDAVHRYLRGYRLPCLTAQDGTVSAVQEFSFSNTDRNASPIPPKPEPGQPPLCIVMPREDMQFNPDGYRRKAENVVALATFQGDGKQAPKVKLLHSSASPDFEASVRKRVAEYRMPCRQGSEPAQHLQQSFKLTTGEVARLKRDVFTLREFLMLTREPRKLKASYDLNTMGCPFQVTYTLHGGTFPHEADVQGPFDPNKLPFLDWLAGLELNITPDQVEDLFGTELQINVPCGRVNLSGES